MAKQIPLRIIDYGRGHRVVVRADTGKPVKITPTTSPEEERGEVGYIRGHPRNLSGRDLDFYDPKTQERTWHFKIA